MYGLVELTQSVAALLALLVGLGLPASTPLIQLRDEVSERWDTLLFLILSLSAAAIFVAMAAAVVLAQLLSLWVMIPLSVGLLLTQGFWAVTLKSRGKGSTALFLETGFWLAALLGAILAYGLGMPASWIVLALGFYALSLWIVTLRSYLFARERFDLKDLINNFKLGAPLMLISLLSLLVVASGRLILGVVSTVEHVGLYSVLFRATSLPLIGHQMIMVGVFRQLFLWDTKTLAARIPLIPVAVFSFVLLFWSFNGMYGWVLGPRFVEVFSEYRVEGLIVLSQTLLWSGVALNDLLNSRLQIAGYVSRIGIVVLFPSIVILAAVLSLSPSDVETQLIRRLVLGHSLIIFVFFISQCCAMYKKGFGFMRLWAAVTLCYLASVSLIFLREFV